MLDGTHVELLLIAQILQDLDIVILLATLLLSRHIVSTKVFHLECFTSCVHCCKYVTTRWLQVSDGKCPWESLQVFEVRTSPADSTL